MRAVGGPAMMRALRWHARGDVRLDNVPRPAAPSDGEVQLRVLWCGVCGTDVEELRAGPIFIPLEPHPLTGAYAPLTLGHEVTGEIVAVPPRSRWTPGAYVAVDGLSFCGTCRYCRRHRVTLCEKLSSIGLMSDGGLAEFVNVPEAGCYAIPDGVGTDAAALSETLAVGVRALRRGRMSPGDRVTVFGAGPVGLLAAQAARAMGACRVWAVDPDTSRREIARALGLDQALDPSDVDEGNADLVLECSGAAEGARAAVRAADRSGRVVLVGIAPEPAAIDLLSVLMGEREILGSLSHVYDEDFAAAVHMLGAGVVDAAPLISTRLPLSRALDGLLALAEPGHGFMKVLVTPEELPA